VFREAIVRSPGYAVSAPLLLRREHLRASKQETAQHLLACSPLEEKETLAFRGCGAIGKGSASTAFLFLAEKYQDEALTPLS
jgi:hypothetical protein